MTYDERIKELGIKPNPRRIWTRPFKKKAFKEVAIEDEMSFVVPGWAFWTPEDISLEGGDHA